MDHVHSFSWATDKKPQMKRKLSLEGSNRSYRPYKEGKKNVKLCIICKTEEKHLHRITEDEAEVLSTQYDIEITSNHRACCRHWVYHSSEIFKSNTRPSLLKDTTPYHSSPIHRLPPLKQEYVKPPKPTQQMNQKQLLRLLQTKEGNEQEMRIKIEELETEIELMKRRPYEIIFEICREKSDEGTKQLLGSNFLFFVYYYY